MYSIIHIYTNGIHSITRAYACDGGAGSGGCGGSGGGGSGGVFINIYIYSYIIHHLD